MTKINLEGNIAGREKPSPYTVNEAKKMGIEGVVESIRQKIQHIQEKKTQNSGFWSKKAN